MCHQIPFCQLNLPTVAPLLRENPVPILIVAAILHVRMLPRKTPSFEPRYSSSITLNVTFCCASDGFQRRLFVLSQQSHKAIVDVNCVTSSWFDVVWRNPDH
jgi:hypothetical protein